MSATQKDLEVMQQRLLEMELACMRTKGAEYTHGQEDRLSSFREISQLTGVSMLKVCFVFLTKHFQSVANFAGAEKVESNESLESRIVDLRLYLLLFLLIAKEQNLLVAKEGECSLFQSGK